MFRQRPKQQLNARMLPAEGGGDQGAKPAQAGAVAGTAPATAGDAAAGEARPSATGSVGGWTGAISQKEDKKVLGIEELLFVLKRDPTYARSAVHYRIRSAHSAKQAAGAQ